MRRSRVVRRALGLFGVVVVVPLVGCVAAPAPVIGLATAGDARATVSWSPPPGDTAYVVQSYVVTPFVGSTPQTPTTVGPNETSAVITGLTNGTTYAFAVKALDDSGGYTASSKSSNAVTPFETPLGTGRFNTCNVMPDTTLKCWGAHLGSSPPYPTTPELVPGLTEVRTMDGGTSHTCVLFTDGTVKCWGQNDQGQLGDGTFTNSATPVAVSGITDAISLSAGNTHTCVVLSGGTAKCWGRNAVGQLGNGSTLNVPTPSTVTGLTGAVTIHASDIATCALQAAGTIKCWGSNSFRQLGNGSPPSVNALTPVAVTGISDANALTGGSDVNCAIVTGSVLKCWGYNFYGEVGDGTSNPASTPIIVPGLPPVRAVGGGDAFVCAVLIGGTVDCWGQNGRGQIGNGTFDFGYVVNPNPSPVAGLTDVVAIAVGGSHTCVLTGTGAEKCWGFNDRGQLGDGTTTNAATPVTVVGL